MAYHSERWSRACGTGIGLSSHKNEFRQGVLIENWVENDHAKSDSINGNNLYGKHGAPLQGMTTSMTDYNEMGKTGTVLLEISDRRDLEKPSEQPVDQMFSHGLEGQPVEFHEQSLNSLTYGVPDVTKKPKTHRYLWAGSKFNDATVPHGISAPGSKAAAAKAKAAAEMAGFDPYHTTSKDFAESAYTLGPAEKRTTVLPKSEGGQEAQVGRKAKGDMCSSFDMSHQKIGLRK